MAKANGGNSSVMKGGVDVSSSEGARASEVEAVAQRNKETKKAKKYENSKETN